MATSVGEIGLDLVVNKNGFDKQMSGIISLAKKAGSALAGAFAVKKLVTFGKEAIELGSALDEVQNVVDVTFPHMTKEIDAFSKNAASSFGLSETMAKRFSGTFGAMARAFGFSEKQAADMSTALTRLAGDVASFYDIGQDEAYTKLKSVFTGETETLKDLGVVMTQNALDSYAMANGYAKTTAQMSEAEKVALRYAFVQEKLAFAQGDFARTSGSWANQVRLLKLNFDSLKASIGQGLINVLTPVIKVMNTMLGKLNTLASAFKSFTEMLTGKKSKSGGMAAPISDLAGSVGDATAGLTDASGAAGGLGKATDKVGKAAKKAAKEMRSLMGFDQINKLTEKSDDTDSDTGATTPGSGVPDSIPSVDYGSLAEGETIVDKLDSKFLKFFENMRNGIQPTIDALKRLKNEGLAELGKFTWTALKDFYEHFLVPVAAWTFGEGIPRFIDALNNGLMKVDFGKINAGLNRLWDALTPFAINVGEGLLWFWENVLVPFGTWAANEVVPRFLDTLSIAIGGLNNIIEALKPLFQWFWDTVLLPIAQWTGGVFLKTWDVINSALQKFSDWCGKNPGVVQGITVAVAGFFGAWKTIELLSFIQQSGGVVAALGRISTALFGVSVAKLKDKLETMALTSMYAKDFVVSIGKSIGELAKQAGQIAITTGAKIADKVAQLAMTAATVAWNVVCTIATGLTTAFGAAVAFLTSPIGLAILAIGAIIAVGVLLYKNWDKIKEAATQLGAWLSETFQKIKDKVNEVWNGVKTKISDVWNSIKSTTQDIWNGIKSTVIGIWDNLKSKVSGVFGDIKDTIASVWDSVKTKTRDTWEGLKEIIKNPINAILGFVNGLLRGIQGMVNGIADALNTISIDLPGWLEDLTGYSSIGFDIPHWRAPQIPYLAQGGYVQKNTPQLAMIGDNRHQGEIVAPEDKLRQIAADAVRAAGSGGISKAELESIINNAVLRIIAALGQMGFYVDGELLARAIQKAHESLDGRYNPVKLI